jgi:Uma2 family endonuclease
MATQSSLVPSADIEYPDDDGNPMSDNTLQFQWIVTIQGNLDGMYAGDENVFVAGNLLWYPVEGHPEIRTAPDTMVVFGRQKGYRGSYKQWVEGGIAPQVVWEVLSPGNRPDEMGRKFDFYDRYGVDEYYLYDPDHAELFGWLRRQGHLRPIPQMNGHVSPRLGIRFDLSSDGLVIIRPDGQPFLTFVELVQQAADAQRQAEQERLAREELQSRAERLAERLRALGIDPNEGQGS